MASGADVQARVLADVERRVAVRVQHARVAAVVVLGLGIEAVERRRVVDALRVVARPGQPVARVVVVLLVVNVVVERAGRDHQAAAALAELGVEQRAQAVGGQRALVEVVLAVVVAAALGQQRILLLDARGQRVGQVDAGIELEPVAQVDLVERQRRCGRAEQRHRRRHGGGLGHRFHRDSLRAMRVSCRPGARPRA